MAYCILEHPRQPVAVVRFADQGMASVVFRTPAMGVFCPQWSLFPLKDGAAHSFLPLCPRAMVARPRIFPLVSVPQRAMVRVPEFLDLASIPVPPVLTIEGKVWLDNWALAPKLLPVMSQVVKSAKV